MFVFLDETCMQTFFDIIDHIPEKFIHGVVLHSIVLLRSLLYCIVNLLLGGYVVVKN